MKPSEPVTGSALPDSRGINLYRADPGYRGLLALYPEPALYAHLERHFGRLGATEFAQTASAAKDNAHARQAARLIEAFALQRA